MCIRDRYQRRVHGDSEGKQKIKSVTEKRTQIREMLRQSFTEKENAEFKFADPKSLLKIISISSAIFGFLTTVTIFTAATTGTSLFRSDMILPFAFSICYTVGHGFFLKGFFALEYHHISLGKKLIGAGGYGLSTFLLYAAYELAFMPYVYVEHQALFAFLVACWGTLYALFATLHIIGINV
eukprot:TRINITY_DN824_c0_g1_i1.p1 TRINITY_DN824_c0_g1~~TRINITY_DN824_c0_g1_i1.p1  ORF type:complete len:207 (-),score=50.18 TRINITY_DN824_c0_g1_i1:261-806(-)